MGVTFTGPQRDTYTVTAATLAEVVDLLTGDDEEEAGKAEWPQTYTAQLDADGKITSASVTVALKITMPVWDGYANATQAEKTEWDRFLAALERHEQGHIDIARRDMATIDQVLVGKTEAEGQHEFTHAVAAVQATSDAYDTSTDHGRNDGTIITIP